ncbi:MAG: peptidoglycan DD-metalloendopeptidase family protein [bacterium]|nr:peptidoglycan DD-metalloendopeptidase family protein [bacterium]
MKTNKNTSAYIRFIYLFIGIAFVPLLFSSLLQCSDSNSKIGQEPAQKKVPNTFGFYSDSLEQQTYSVAKNETLSDILLKHGVSASNINQIVNKAQPYLDVKRIVAGNIYHAFTFDDSSSTLAYFVYEKNPKHFVVFNLKDSIQVYESEKEIIIRENQKSAVIDQSLWVSLIDVEATPELAIKLSQIFAWQIDFYHLQKGDNFKVIYEELFIDDKFFAIGKILGACFNHNGKDFYAVPFMQDSVSQYFDEDGNSLRKAFLKAPLEFGRISSRYSKSRLHPVLKTRRPHLGVDYAAPVGTPIRSTGDGAVAEIGYNGGAGKFIKIRHNSVYTTMYLHLSRYAKGLKKGARVQQGQIIGYVGSTGLSTGPHLDYRFFINGKAVDPLKVEVPPSHPVKDELKVQYIIQKDSVLQMLDKIHIPVITNPA